MIISRYIFREISSILLALTVLLFLIYISQRFLAYLVQASSGSLPSEFILHLLGLKILADAMLILPLAFFLSILIALGRLYKDNEITAMAACGIPVPFKSIMLIGSLFAVLVGTLSLSMAPWAERQLYDIKLKASRTAEVGGIMAGRFKEFAQGNGVFYIESIHPDDDVMKHVFVNANLPGRRIILTAKKAYQKSQGNDLFMVMVDGHRYENKPGSLEFVITHFTEHSIKIPKSLKDSDKKEESRAAIPTLTLFQKTEPLYQAELQWRLSIPLSILLLTALAVPLSYTTPRQGQYAKILAGVLIYLTYANLLNVGQKWVARGEVPVWLGVWWIHLLCLALVLTLLYWRNFKGWYFERGRKRAMTS